jgi:hypothetical protein
MAITSGTYYVGPSETLVNWTAAAAQISGQTLTGGVTFIQSGDITETSTVYWACTIPPSYKLHLTSNLHPLGDILNGHKTRLHTGGHGNRFTISNDGVVEISHLNFIEGSSHWHLTLLDGYFKIHDCISVETGGLGSYFVGVQSTVVNLELFNVKTYGLGCNLVTSNAIGSIFKIENCSVFNGYEFGIYCDGTNGVNQYIKNCVFYKGYASGVGNPCIITSGITLINNASSDSSAIGTGCITGITTSVFLSVDPTSSNFLKLATDSILKDAGTNVSISANTYGIAGNRRPHNVSNPSYSIGAEELIMSYDMNFTVDKRESTIPFYFRLTDLSDISSETSATDYLRIWSITNLRTSAIEFFESTSASINCCISANSNYGDLYTVSLSASY